MFIAECSFTTAKNQKYPSTGKKEKKKERVNKFWDVEMRQWNITEQ